MGWESTEAGHADLGDTRLELRLLALLEVFGHRLNDSIPQAFGAAAEVMAAYRFFANDRVDPDAILAAHAVSVVRRAAGHPVVLVAQDTTEINLTSHPATSGLGYLASSKTRGVLVHGCLAIAPDGRPLGTIDQLRWTRPPEQLGKAKDRHGKATEDKESQRWINGLRATQKALSDHPRVVLIGDRESDIFDLFAEPRHGNVELLVRVCRHNRRVNHPQRVLNAALKSTEVKGVLEVSIPASQDRPPRLAKLGIRWMTLTIQSPAWRRPASSVAMNYLMAEEIDPPETIQPVQWILATTMPIAGIEDAGQLILWYTRRWTIERFHYTLKSGCRVEQQQFHSLKNVERFLAVLSIAAWRVLWLTYEARQNPDAACTCVLSDSQWRVLWAVEHRKRRGRATAIAPPDSPPSLREAMQMIGRLGGHLHRKGDGPPGVKAIWRGLSRLDDIHLGWYLAHAPPSLPPQAENHLRKG